jgi:hypothetical protein
MHGETLLFTRASLGPYGWSDIANISLSIVFDPGVIEINVFPVCVYESGGCDWNIQTALRAPLGPSVPLHNSYLANQIYILSYRYA